MTTPMKTPVIFRKWRPRNGVIIALFPTIPADLVGAYCQSYEHVGGHGGADYELTMRSTRPASPVEYAELKEELEKIGYVLSVRKRSSEEYRKARRMAALRERVGRW